MISEQRKKELEYISVLTRLNRERFTREENYLIILSRDLRKEFEAIQVLGIERAKKEQLFFDFILNFEELRDKMKEFRWNNDFLMEHGIPFKDYRKLYFAVS